nr:uncharacterized protein LOC112749345 isoform X2 [Arachis hypogaea]
MKREGVEGRASPAWRHCRRRVLPSLPSGGRRCYSRARPRHRSGLRRERKLARGLVRERGGRSRKGVRAVAAPPKRRPFAASEARCRCVAPVCRAATVAQGRPPLLLCPPTAPLHEPEDLSLLSHRRQSPIREKLDRQGDRWEGVVEPRRCCWGLTATVLVVAGAVAEFWGHRNHRRSFRLLLPSPKKLPFLQLPQSDHFQQGK